jgi:hypothetical protein
MIFSTISCSPRSAFSSRNVADVTEALATALLVGRRATKSVRKNAAVVACVGIIGVSRLRR